MASSRASCRLRRASERLHGAAIALRTDRARRRGFAGRGELDLQRDAIDQCAGRARAAPRGTRCRRCSISTRWRSTATRAASDGVALAADRLERAQQLAAPRLELVDRQAAADVAAGRVAERRDRGDVRGGLLIRNAAQRRKMSSSARNRSRSASTSAAVAAPAGIASVATRAFSAAARCVSAALPRALIASSSARSSARRASKCARDLVRRFARRRNERRCRGGRLRGSRHGVGDAQDRRAHARQATCRPGRRGGRRVERIAIALERLAEANEIGRRHRRQRLRLQRARQRRDLRLQRQPLGALALLDRRCAAAASGCRAPSRRGAPCG